MVALNRNVWTVADLMLRLHLDIAGLARATGVEPKIVDAIVHHRYTPCLKHRQRIAAVLGVGHSQLIWGHAGTVE